jgi:hypothetical protein
MTEADVKRVEKIRTICQELIAKEMKTGAYEPPEFSIHQVMPLIRIIDQQSSTISALEGKIEQLKKLIYMPGFEYAAELSRQKSRVDHMTMEFECEYEANQKNKAELSRLKAGIERIHSAPLNEPGAALHMATMAEELLAGGGDNDEG